MSNLIYKGIVAGALALFAALPALAQEETAAVRTTAQSTREGIRIVDPSFVRKGSTMNVAMGFEFAGFVVKSAETTVLTPMIVNDIDTLRLPSVSIYGRTSWYMSNRNHRMPLGGNEGEVIRYEKHLEPVAYAQRVRYADWMNGAELIVERTDYGCAGCSEGTTVSELARYKNVEYQPTFAYQAAVAEEVKTRELSGRAYVDFPVNRTEIYPNYRRNAVELAKIIGTIDSVKNDPDITVRAISIKGFASPEGSYANNERLAKGRTEALKNYVQSLYHFQPGFIKTDYEPEDWEGLRDYVGHSILPNRTEILAIIDDAYLDPDIKDKRIQARFSEDYRFLLQTVYPGLRHSDYTIEYVIRSFNDPAEIRKTLHTAPQKLSLDEIYRATQDLEVGSDEYNEIFETAVRLFPGEAAANLNAANAAMQRRDLVSAARYLERAGEGPEVTYARGVLAALNGDVKGGIALVEQAMTEGFTPDPEVLDHLREVAEYSSED